MAVEVQKDAQTTTGSADGRLPSPTRAAESPMELPPEPVHYIQGSGKGVLQMTSDGCVDGWWVGGVLPWHGRVHTSDVSEDRFAGTVGWRCDADNRAG